MKLAHLLTALLVLLAVVDQLLIHRLKHTGEPRPRIRIYSLIMAGHWLATAWAAAIMGLPGLWNVSISPAMAKWIPQPWVIAVLVVISLCMIAAPAMLARRPRTASAVERALARLSYILPQNRRERLWWVALSLTAGICEECLFRSFLFWYLQAPLWHLGFAASIVGACVLFALGHLYQGPLPAVATGALALLLFVFFLATGNLLLPIVMHSLTDMRILLVTPHVRNQNAPVAVI
jgi:CAAX protease family protein